MNVGDLLKVLKSFDKNLNVKIRAENTCAEDGSGLFDERALNIFIEDEADDWRPALIIEGEH